MLYEIVVSNAGPSDAQDVVVTDTLDAQVSFSGASSGCVHDRLAYQWRCGLHSRNVGRRRFQIVPDLSTGRWTQPRMAISSPMLSLPRPAATDPTPDNSDSVTTTVEGFGNIADVAIAKVTSSSVVTAGEQITYTLTVTNAGPAVATNVRVLELIPAGTTAISLTPTNPDDASAYCSLGGGCFLGQVFTTTTATIEVVLQVNADYAGTSLTNSASVSADQQDPKTDNNFDDTTTPVETSADLGIAKSDMVDPVIAGELLQYQLVISNTGPSRCP